MALNEFLRSVKQRDPAAKSNLQILLFYSGVRAVLRHKVENYFYRHKMRFLAECMANHTRRKTGVEIHPAATIGKNLFIDHGMGVVIGETTVIGDNCTIYQGATLGGTGKEQGKRHPTLGNNVVVGAGAKVLGNITIGNNVKIGANAIVLTDVPDNCTVVGVGRIIVRGPQCVMRNEAHRPTH